MLSIDSFVSESSGDVLYLRDGQLDASALIASLSGSYTTLPGPFASQAQYLYLRFITNSATVYTGFSVSYKITTTGELFSIQLAAINRLSLETCDKKYPRAIHMTPTNRKLT